ncbi:MAG TPA: aminodeoxychorismate/anthranilate synthase component II [Candidatus Omnitrophica bacterium]|nr:MAG: aminodeoxychorismate/anthranilate synthase component II [Candidatus Omnitrophota bacterium]RKY43422.1 MAG: aminodeoxychorismate/anthranilate synthase component II [Candidatus Omnitrophota bacterium]HEC68690.1 aminodeoxychorismate/anthranilate synthase component II [Candidatus Omnitrophota bacterium]
MKVLLIDNYDSFVYNLYQYLLELGAEVVVKRNDELGLKDILRIRPSKIVISPGPGRPESAGISVELIKEFYDKIPILGVCLGHQAIGYALGAKIVRAKKIMHGKTSLIYHRKKDIFKNIPSPFTATRYHSLIIENKNLPPNLEITAFTEDKEIMGIRVKGSKCFGIQFHPESILTKEGKTLLKNFLNL